MQRAFSSNGWHSKSEEFQKETALRAAGFELCLCKAGRLMEKRLFTFLGGGENPRRRKVKVPEPDRQGEREFTNRRESKGRKKREEGVGTGRQEIKRERAGHIEGEHWPRALIHAALPFSCSVETLEGDKKEQKPTFHSYLWECRSCRCPT